MEKFTGSRYPEGHFETSSLNASGSVSSPRLKEVSSEPHVTDNSDRKASIEIRPQGREVLQTRLRHRQDWASTSKARAADSSESEEASYVLPRLNWHRRTFSDSDRPTKLILPQYTDLQTIVRLDSEIGKGSSGTVMKGRLCENSKLVACKSVSKFGLQLPKDAVTIRNEAQALLAMQQHPAVIGFHGLYEDAKEVHFLFDYCSGGDLFSRIKERRFFTEPESAGICRTLISVLAHAHERGIMHRDLKPENIFLVSKYNDSDIRLGDFGSVAFFSPGQKMTEFVGSSMYLAPSVLKGSYGPEADLWSLGVVLYILLSGVPPFPGETDADVFRSIRQGRLDLKSRRWRYVSEEAKDLVARLLEKDDSKRLTAAQALDHAWMRRSCLCHTLEGDDVPIARPVPAGVNQSADSRSWRSTEAHRMETRDTGGITGRAQSGDFGATWRRRIGKGCGGPLFPLEDDEGRYFTGEERKREESSG